MYFAITIPTSSYLGLMPYFRQEGMAYRVLPFEFSVEDGNRGGIDLDLMYENLMTKYWFRGLQEGSDVYLDANIRRMMGNFRNNYMRLATSFVNEAKRLERSELILRATNPSSDSIPMLQAKIKQHYERAKETMDYSLKNMHESIVPAPSYIYAQYGQVYGELAQKGYDTQKDAAQMLELSRKRARIELVKKYASMPKGQVLNIQQDLDFYALNLAMNTYGSVLGDNQGAAATAGEMYVFSGERQFQQMQQQFLRGAAAKGDVEQRDPANAGATQDSTRP
jgi:hypothetical protein